MVPAGRSATTAGCRRRCPATPNRSNTTTTTNSTCIGLLATAAVLAAVAALLAAPAAHATDFSSVTDAEVRAGLERSLPEYERGFDQEWKLGNSSKRRLAQGGMALAAECARVQELARNVARLGRQCIRTHSIYGVLSPYTPRESVVSVRAVQAVRMANKDPEMFQEGLETFLGITMRVRERIMEAFNETKLFFHLSEMVCRRPRHWDSPEQCIADGCMPYCMDGCPQECVAGLQGRAGQEQGSADALLADCTESCTADCRESCTESCSGDTWLSHPIHADANPDDCDLLDDGVCMRRLPEDYTSHVYLNEDFEGGNFFFTDDMEGSNPVPIQPTCGRMLAYSSGFENLHGVTAVRGGERCLVTMWFTREENKIEELPLPTGSPFLVGRRQGRGRGFDPTAEEGDEPSAAAGAGAEKPGFCTAPGEAAGDDSGSCTN